MSAYHQMGHNTQNLMAQVKGYVGAVTSPVNDSPEVMTRHVKTHKSDSFSIAFDPQLYNPRIAAKELAGWPYYPDPATTHDLSDRSWWSRLHSGLWSQVSALEVNAVCSPAQIPKSFSLDYFTELVEQSDMFAQGARDGIEPWFTVIAATRDLVELDYVMKAASILSSTSMERIFLVFIAGGSTRQNLDDAAQLRGAMRLIHELEKAGVSVLVGFSGIEMVLWKAAGASDCATGKWLNLRRFDPDRFIEKDSEGRQTEYLMEHSILGLIGPQEALRMEKEGLLSENTLSNPYAVEYLSEMKKTSPKGQFRLSWLAYLHWFSEIEAAITSGEINVRDLLISVEDRWETFNDESTEFVFPSYLRRGAWIKSWRQALSDFKKDNWPNF